jgi:hypothetical protein
MKKVSVAAERDYTVSIGSPWNAALVPLFHQVFLRTLLRCKRWIAKFIFSLFQMAKMRRILQPFLIFGIGLAQLALLAQT